jgi:hypothetical protein
MWAHQYDQQSNQVLVTGSKRNWSTNGDFSNIYGLMPNFACCLANMHQGWPKLVESMWMATNDNGLATVAYGPSVVEAMVGNGKKVKISEDTGYPFRNSIKLTIGTDKIVKFPLYIRIPSWTDSTRITYRSKEIIISGASVHRLEERWKNGEEILIEFLMPMRTEKRYNNSVTVYRGPLMFSLRIEKEYKSAKINYDNFAYKGSVDWEIKPISDWNYGLITGKNLEPTGMEVSLNTIGKYPFADSGDPIWSDDSLRYITSYQDPPVVISARGMKIPGWGMKDNSADVPPISPVKPEGDPERITLVPYGSARLRITEFPVMDVIMMENMRVQ